MMTQPIHTIVTHAGAFHADEIMAIALLERFYLLRPLRMAIGMGASDIEALVAHGRRPPFSAPIGPDGLVDAREPCWVVRTRTPALLKLAKENPDVIVLDVGGELDPGKLNFDHHQGSMTDGWEDGTPYSSTGLAWRWLQSQGLLHGMDSQMQAEIEVLLIRPLDAHDNGVSVHDDAETVEAYNRSAGDFDGQALQFDKALSFMRDVLDNTIYRATVKLQARRQLEAGWTMAQARGENFVILEEAMGYNDGTGLLKELSGGQAMMLGIPGRGNLYSVISVSGDEGRFSVRCPVPEEWRGRMDFEVDIDGRRTALAFAHKTGFMCVVKGGANEAHRVAKATVAHNLKLEAGHAPSRGPKRHA